MALWGNSEGDAPNKNHKGYYLGIWARISACAGLSFFFRRVETHPWIWPKQGDEGWPGQHARPCKDAPVLPLNPKPQTLMNCSLNPKP